MTEPIGSCRDSIDPTLSTDEVLRAVTHARSEASANLPTESREVDEHMEAAHHATAAAEAIISVASGVGLIAEGSALELPAAIAGTTLVWLHGWTEADRQQIAFDSNSMRGALAALEGRADDDDVRARAAASPAFADGIRDVERLFTADHDAFLCYAQTVRAAVTAGADAVYGGEDTSPEFRRRYDSDLAFHHGVDRARELRETDPAAYETARAARTATSDEVRDVRLSAMARA